MYPKFMVYAGIKVWGQMPSGEIKEFKSPFEYELAYYQEEDEIADELARLDSHDVDDLHNDIYITA